MGQKALAIDNMSCGHCVARVKKALEAVPGITVQRRADRIGAGRGCANRARSPRPFGRSTTRAIRRACPEAVPSTRPAATGRTSWQTQT